MIPPALVQRCADLVDRFCDLNVATRDILVSEIIAVVSPAIEAAAYERAALTFEEEASAAERHHKAMHARWNPATEREPPMQTEYRQRTWTLRHYQQRIRALAPKPHHPSKGDEG